MRDLSYIGAEKITFPLKPDIQTFIQTDGRTLAFTKNSNILEGRGEVGKKGEGEGHKRQRGK